MRRQLGRLLRVLIRFVVGFFPLIAACFLVFVDLLSPRFLLRLTAALILAVTGLLWFFARRDPVLRLAIGLGSVLLGVAMLCGALLAVGLADWSPQSMWQVWATPTPVPTPPMRQGRLWRSAANEWLAGGLWPDTPVTVRPAPQPGTYAVAFREPLQAVVVVAPWGAPPRPAILLRAQAHWEGLSASGAWGVVCHYHEQRWTVADAARFAPPTTMPLGVPPADRPEFYALVLSGDGFAAIWKHTVEGAWRLTPWTAVPPVAGPTPSPSTPTPTTAPVPVPSPTPTPGLPVQRGQQDLHAVCNRGVLQLYVNGRLVVQARDDALAPGQVGLWAAAPPVAPWQVVWTQFRVYTLASP